MGEKETAYNNDLLEQTLVSLELGRRITDLEYFNLKIAIKELRKLSNKGDNK